MMMDRLGPGPVREGAGKTGFRTGLRGTHARSMPNSRSGVKRLSGKPMKAV